MTNAGPATSIGRFWSAALRRDPSVIRKDFEGDPWDDVFVEAMLRSLLRRRFNLVDVQTTLDARAIERYLDSSPPRTAHGFSADEKKVAVALSQAVLGRPDLVATMSKDELSAAAGKLIADLVASLELSHSEINIFVATCENYIVDRRSAYESTLNSDSR